MVAYGNTLGCQGNYNYAPEDARKEIEAQYPGWRVAALVPGHHMSGASIFDPFPSGDRVNQVSENQEIDVWSIPSGQVPAGKLPNCS
jgi:hypothetical protein